MITNRFAALLDAKSKQDNRKYSYYHIARATGLGSYTIWRWYANKVAGSDWHTVEKLCKWLDCPIESLLELTPKK